MLALERDEKSGGYIVRAGTQDPVTVES